MKKIRAAMKAVRLMVILLVAFFFCYYQNNHLTVSHYTVTSNKLGKNFPEYRIVQISDLHNKSFGRDNERLLERIRELKPDMVVITGDIVDGNHTDVDVAVSFAGAAASIAPVCYVTGNHEGWLDRDERTRLFKEITDAGVTVLDNEAVQIGEGTDKLWIAGLDDGHLLDDALKDIKLSADNFNLLLAHEPQYIKQYAEEPVDLVLSGHAHGGQFRLPFVGGVVAPDQGFFPKYTQGEYTEKNTRMIVSRGLGNSVIPLRLFNCPDIVCVTLRRE